MCDQKKQTSSKRNNAMLTTNANMRSNKCHIQFSMSPQYASVNQRTYVKTIFLSDDPCLPGAPRLGISDTIVLKVPFNGLLSIFSRNKNPTDYHHPRMLELDSHWNSIYFQTILRCTQKAKTLPRSFQKTMKSNPKSLKRKFWEQFCCETPKRLEFDSSFGRKNVLETNSNRRKNLKPRCSKSFQNGVNLIPDPHVSLLLLPWFPRGLPRCQNSPPGHQNEDTNPPKNVGFGQNHNLKGAGGKGSKPWNNRWSGTWMRH